MGNDKLGLVLFYVSIRIFKKSLNKMWENVSGYFMYLNSHRTLFLRLNDNKTIWNE